MFDRQVQWNQIIQANIDELYSMREDAGYPRIYQFYIRAILAFLQHDFSGLRAVGDELMSHPEVGPEELDQDFKLVTLLIRARVELRGKQVQKGLLREIGQIAAGNTLYCGESAFVLGMIQESQEELRDARLSYLSASQKLEATGAYRKGLKALQNSVACESRRRPEGNYTSEYEFIAKNALSVQATDVAAVAFNNISREYQQIGATLVALNYASRALEFFEKDSYGTLNHHLAILQRCHILIELKRLEEARVDFERASISPFPAVREALDVIRGWIESPNSESPFRVGTNLTMSWQQRFREGILITSRTSSSGASDSDANFSNRLTDYEMKLIALIGDAPKTRFELISALYGENVDLASTENRIKVFLSRVRKKKPGLILMKDGKYFLAPNLYPELKSKRVS